MNDDNDSDRSNIDKSNNSDNKGVFPEINRNDLLDRIKRYFLNSELSNLEKYYENRETEVNDLMYKFYDITKEIEVVKLMMPILKPPQVEKFIKKRDYELYGGSSTMSRRSNSSTSSRFFWGSGAFRPKPKFGAQKVSINISGSLECDNSIIRKDSKSVDPKISNLKKDLIGTTKVSKSIEVFNSEQNNKTNNAANTNTTQNKLKTDLTNANKDKTKAEANIKGIIDAAKNNCVNKTLLKKESLIMKNNVQTSESIDKESANKVKSSLTATAAKPTSSTGVSSANSGSATKPKTPAKKTELINKVKSNSSSVTTTETDRPKSFKFEPKKKQASLLNGKVESIIFIVN